MPHRRAPQCSIQNNKEHDSHATPKKPTPLILVNLVLSGFPKPIVPVNFFEKARRSPLPLIQSRCVPTAPSKGGVRTRQRRKVVDFTFGERERLEHRGVGGAKPLDLGPWKPQRNAI